MTSRFFGIVDINNSEGSSFWMIKCTAGTQYPLGESLYVIRNTFDTPNVHTFQIIDEFNAVM